MKNKSKKYFFFFLFFSQLINSDFIPIDGTSLNYTQIFFKWPQLNNKYSYNIQIIDNEANDQANDFSYNININSMIIDNFEWNKQYDWQVCAIDEFENNLECHNWQSFNINQLPNNFPDEINIFQLDSSQFQEGITILDFESIYFSVGLDMVGDPVWFADRTNFPSSGITATQIQTNGNFIGFFDGIGYEFNLNSEIIFQTSPDFEIHLSIYKTQSGTYFFIIKTLEEHLCPNECSDWGNILWKGDTFIEVDNEGNILWEWNTFNYLSLDEYNPYWIETFNPVNGFDWTHSNSVYFDSETNTVLISIRNLSRISAIDYSTQQIIWNIGNPNFMEQVSFEDDFGFSHQHSAQLTPNGNLLFYDNGRNNIPQINRCLELDIDGNQEVQFVWEYVLPDTIYTFSRGECDRLLNNNTLISAGRAGHVFEVNSNNEIVWHFLAKENNGMPVAIHRSERIPNLYSNIFSFEINNLAGNYPNYFISCNQNNLDININNNGWSSQNYKYQLLDHMNNILYENQINIFSYTEENITLNLSNLIIGNYIFKVYPINYSDQYQDILFTINNGIGDLDNNGIINLIDILYLVTILNTYNNDTCNDINLDGSIDVMDILIILVDIILT